MRRENEQLDEDGSARYEPPAIEAREPLCDPLVGVVSGRMM